MNIKKPVLFDISKDISESKNVASEYPQIVEKLLLIAEQARKKLGEYNIRGSKQRPTGTIFSDVLVVSHPRYWRTLS